MTRRERHLVILAVAIALLVGAVRLGDPVLRAARHRVETARDQHALLVRARALVDDTPSARERLAARADELLRAAPLLVPGETAADAAASFAARITSAAAANRVRIEHLEPAPDSLAGDYLVVTLRVRAESDLAGIAGFLATLESGRPLVSVTRFALSNEEVMADPQRLRLDITLRGWALATNSGASG